MDAPETQAKPVIGRPFEKGNRASVGIGRKGKVGEEGDPSRLLTDMRAVYSTGKNADRTAAKRKLRQFFNDDPKGYVAQMAKLEEAERGLKAEAVAASVVDEGEGRVLELVGRLLGGYSDGTGDGVEGRSGSHPQGGA